MADETVLLAGFSHETNTFASGKTDDRVLVRTGTDGTEIEDADPLTHFYSSVNYPSRSLL